MGKYKFYQDRKVTSWERDYFSVEAESYEEAVSIIRSWGCEDVSNISDKRLFYDEWFALPETSEPLLPDYGDFQSIRRVYNDQCSGRNTVKLKTVVWT